MTPYLCHFEVMSDDPAKSQTFYNRVFGWKIEEQGFPGYAMIQTGKEPCGGMMRRPEAAPAPALNVYFMVESIEATLSKVAEAGGQMIVPKTQIPGVGHFAFFLDPEGIAVGIFQQ